ncbi:hypothetical protein PUN28_009310 [Cardiocondyla obscurior]|uniref:Uncharacterized protein n=1 Tax=Cardiocondyla obscurior TaxID=286306 RepID=A0AAW2FWG6_9HYME
MFTCSNFNYLIPNVPQFNVKFHIIIPHRHTHLRNIAIIHYYVYYYESLLYICNLSHPSIIRFRCISNNFFFVFSAVFFN